MRKKICYHNNYKENKRVDSRQRMRLNVKVVRAGVREAAHDAKRVQIARLNQEIALRRRVTLRLLGK